MHPLVSAKIDLANNHLPFSVLLGSFSNYLVTHSSVPVMVARRKLKKQTKKTKTNIRLSNNLMTPKSLAMAKVD